MSRFNFNHTVTVGMVSIKKSGTQYDSSHFEYFYVCIILVYSQTKIVASRQAQTQTQTQTQTKTFPVRDKPATLDIRIVSMNESSTDTVHPIID